LGNTYKPTPIDELAKKQRQSRDGSCSISGKSKRSSSLSQGDETDLGRLVDDLIGTKPEKVSKKTKKTSTESSDDGSKKKRKSITNFDLFGDDSKEESGREKKKKEKSCHKSKTDAHVSKKRQFVEVSLFPGEESACSTASAKKAKIEVTSVKCELSPVRKMSEQGEIKEKIIVSCSDPKKRLAHSTDTQKTALLRQSGGERQPKFLTPREQIQMRFAQMQKQKEELMKKSASPSNLGEMSTHLILSQGPSLLRNTRNTRHHTAHLLSLFIPINFKATRATLMLVVQRITT
jgi:hypothetical protein